MRTWPLALATLGLGVAFAADGSGSGSAAPPFELRGSDGKTHRLSDHLGDRAVVLAWFPKAFTGG